MPGLENPNAPHSTREAAQWAARSPADGIELGAGEIALEHRLEPASDRAPQEHDVQLR
jgi:hypothetical protein